MKASTSISLGIALAYQTGLRVSELAGFRWKKVFDDYLLICEAKHSWSDGKKVRHIESGLPKSQKARNVIMSDAAKQVICALKKFHPTLKGYVTLQNNKLGE